MRIVRDNLVNAVLLLFFIVIGCLHSGRVRLVRASSSASTSRSSSIRRAHHLMLLTDKDKEPMKTFLCGTLFRNGPIAFFSQDCIVVLPLLCIGPGQLCLQLGSGGILL